jgi:outer membrane protein assembly factor BamB
MGHFENYVTPLVTSDGGIIFSNGLSKIYCINPDSTMRWEYKVEGISQINHNESLNIDLDGNLYFVNMVNNKLYSISKDGKFNWSLSDERLSRTHPIPFSTAFSPDGKTLYIPCRSVTVLAIDIVNKNVKWSYGNTWCNEIMIDSDGNIYAQVSNGLVVLDKDGKLKWDYIVTPSTSGSPSPTIDKQGNIYFATDTLYALDYTGKLRWKYRLNKTCDVPIICDNNGNIFVGTASGSGITIVALNSNGNLLWTISDDSVYPVGSSPAIDNDGKLIYPCYHRKVIAIK